MESSTPIRKDIYIHEDDTSNSEHVLVESSMPVQVTRYSLVTPVIEDGIEYETVTTSVVTSSESLESPRVNCQIHTYFSHEKKPIHLLNLDPFPKES